MSLPPTPGPPSGFSPETADYERSTDRKHAKWAMTIAVISFVTLIGAAGFRSVPGVLMDPLHMEFGWSHGTISAAVSVNLVLFGVTSPFAAALMDRFGIRRVVAAALTLVALGSGLTVFMTSAWQLVVLWGVVVGLGTGSMSMAFVATITSRWYVARRGLVSGVLTAANATGQLIFLPLIARLTAHHGWRLATLVVAGAALLTVPLVLLLLRDHPHDVGVVAYGASPTDPGQPRLGTSGGVARRALATRAIGARSGTFWLLAGSFAICGATTVGLVGTHFVPAAHDHGMPETTAAGLLALVGVFDIAGTICSGWLTDRYDPRWLLLGYYGLRGLALLTLPTLLAPDVRPSMWLFILFYGLDWVATVPPTVAITREKFGDRGPIVFGWVFASHQIGAAIAAFGAGAIRDATGSYTIAWYAAGGLSIMGAALAVSIRRPRPETRAASAPAEPHLTPTA